MSVFAGSIDAGLQEIRCLIECNDASHNVSKEISLEIEKEVDFEYVIKNSVAELVAEEYVDIVDAAVEEYIIKPKARYSLKEEAEHLYEVAKEYIETNVVGAVITVSILDKNGKKTNQFSYQLSTILKQVLDDRQCGDSYFWDIGHKLERAIDEFLELGEWKSSYCGQEDFRSENLKNEELELLIENNELEFIIWYGTSNTPTENWSVSTKMTEKQLAFWLDSEDDWSLMESILEEPDEQFITWYLYEIGLCPPCIDSVVEQCPIIISEVKSVLDVQKLLMEYAKHKDE